jgi:glycosyltransferase involved in cell wall biosynthesis
MSTIIVFSHLRWNFVYQRPQHLLSRLAREYRVIFVEEPMTQSSGNFLEHISACSGVEVLRPHTTGNTTGFDDGNVEFLHEMVAGYLRQNKISDYAIWLYTPLALPIAKRLSPCATIYDCMDELSAFKNASPHLIHRENELFDVADIVFTGGPSLYESKRTRHHNVYCFPSSVDAAHFAPPGEEIDDHEAQKHIPLPRVGYYGVIDERIDIDLITTLADARPDWQVVMVGPVVKIDPESLPRRDNIHWLGQRSYEDLPRLVRTWDVCMMPFALNESTRFISPTKTLEYMAAERPAVSTPIKDVVDPYKHVVRIAYSHEEFIEACAATMAESETERAARIKAMRSIIAQTSWDKTAYTMGKLIAQLRQRNNRAAAEVVSLPANVRPTSLVRPTATARAAAVAESRATSGL